MTKRFAIVFPGQGSQALGMLKALAAQYPIVGETFAQADPILGFDLWQLSQTGTEQELNRTERTQPLLLAAGMAVWQTWRQQGGPDPAVLAGHSLGEYTALVAAQSVSFADAIALVEKRGQFMQQAVPEGQGAMAAILGLKDDDIIRACEQAREDQIVTAVNFNAPGQVVIAGHKQAVARAIDAAKQAGAKRAILLPVSVPSHCELMLNAAEKLRSQLDHTDFFPPHIPVVNNVDVRAETEPDAVRAALTRQLYQPVRWVESVQHIVQQGIEIILECGPGKILTGLNKRIAKGVQVMSIEDPLVLEQAVKLVSQ